MKMVLKGYLNDDDDDEKEGKEWNALLLYQFKKVNIH